jgi:hypothetical protein
MGKSSDRAGEAAIIIYVDENLQPTVPITVEGVRTLVVPSSAVAVAFGAAPLTNANNAQPLPASTFNEAVSIKQQISRSLMQRNPAFFGVGVGQSLDNPREAALVIYVDRNQLPSVLPATIDGLRTRYVVMERLHVTRSYAVPFEPRGHCMPHPAANSGGTPLSHRLSLNLF